MLRSAPIGPPGGVILTKRKLREKARTTKRRGTHEINTFEMRAVALLRLFIVDDRRFTPPLRRSRWLVRVGLHGRARRTRCPDAAMRLWTLRHPCLCAGRGRSVRLLAYWDADRIGRLRMRSLPARVLVVASGRDPLRVRCSVLLTSVPRQCVATASPASLHRQGRRFRDRASSRRVRQARSPCAFGVAAEARGCATCAAHARHRRLVGAMQK